MQGRVEQLESRFPNTSLPLTTVFGVMDLAWTEVATSLRNNKLESQLGL